MVGISSDGEERYETEAHGGMTLRDYFAGKALQGYLANSTSFGPDVPDEAKNDPRKIAEVSAVFAYMIADAMLAEREVA